MTISMYQLSLNLLIILILCAFIQTNGQTPCQVEEQFTTRLNNTGVFDGVVGAGRVEMCYCIIYGNFSDCNWQTISTGSNTDPFSWKNSIVVCRELGYFDVQSPILQNTIPLSTHAPSSVGIYSRTFDCDGTESSLSNCATGSLTDSQTHQSDAYVTCQTSIVIHKARLVGTTFTNRGVVQIYQSQIGDWATICPSGWTDTEANILCESLGYRIGFAVNYFGPIFRGSMINTAPSIQSVFCSGDIFSRCTFVQSSLCPGNSGSLAGAECYSEIDTADGSVRLYNASTTDDSTYNRVEVYYNGRWGTVCDIFWNSSDGEVACRELGRKYVGIPTSPALFNPLSSRPIFVLDYNCLGIEKNITFCLPSIPIGFITQDCSHLNDAGLECESDDGGIGAIPGAVSASLSVTVFLIIAFIFIYIFVIRDWMKGCDVCDNFCNCLGSCFDFITDCKCDCIRRPAGNNIRNAQRHEQWRMQMENTANATVINIQPRSRSSSSSDSNEASISGSLASTPAAIRDNNRTQPDNPNIDLTAPPSYYDALRLTHIRLPPEYDPPTNIEGGPLPYPIPQSDNFNPAHPPPSQSTDQGYPPPTSPHPPDTVLHQSSSL